MNVEGLGVERERSLHHPASKMKFFIYGMKQYAGADPGPPVEGVLRK